MTQMTICAPTSIRLSKIALLGAIALYFTLVVFNNLTDYSSNYQFVHHVLAMDSTFPGNEGMWRAINSPTIHTLFYLSIIAWETTTGLLSWYATIRLLLRLNAPTLAFEAAKPPAILALTLGCLLWLTAFLTVGAEWFLMWQSHGWNGQEAAFRNFVILALVLVYIAQPDRDPI
jgi:predicted small integral membrane protein